MTDTSADKIRALGLDARNWKSAEVASYREALAACLAIVESTPDPLLEQMAEALKLATTYVDYVAEAEAGSLEGNSAREAMAICERALSTYEARKK